MTLAGVNHTAAHRMHVFDVAPDLRRPDLFRLVAALRFRSTAAGGRNGPVASDYRPNCWFGRRMGDEPVYNDCVVYLRRGGDAYEGPDGGLWVPPGGRCVADLSPLYPSYVRPFVRVGSRFTVCEGHRVVAEGEVRDNLRPRTGSRPRLAGTPQRRHVRLTQQRKSDASG